MDPWGFVRGGKGKIERKEAFQDRKPDVRQKDPE